jgi:hypothetical protein
MTSSRIKRSEGDNASEVNFGMGEGCVGVLDGATSVPLGRIELSGTIPAPAAEVVDASVVERVVKSGGGRGINCVCSVCAGVRVIGEAESTT